MISLLPMFFSLIYILLDFQLGSLPNKRLN